MKIAGTFKHVFLAMFKFNLPAFMGNKNKKPVSRLRNVVEIESRGSVSIKCDF